MEPNYTEGDTIFITHTSNFDRFDVVIVKVEKLTGDEYFIKRVIGLPGDEVVIVNNSIYINGSLIDDDEYIQDGQVTTCSTGPNGQVSDECTWLVGNNEYFVLGDNRMYSNDSRSSIVGLIKDENMYGEVIVKLDLFD